MPMVMLNVPLDDSIFFQNHRWTTFGSLTIHELRNGTALLDFT